MNISDRAKKPVVLKADYEALNKSKLSQLPMYSFLACGEKDAQRNMQHHVQVVYSQHTQR